MSEKSGCLRCGGMNIEPGAFQSTGLIYFRPKDAKLLTVHSSGAVVSARMCLDCGHVELVTKPTSVKSIMRKRTEAASK